MYSKFSYGLVARMALSVTVKAITTETTAFSYKSFSAA